MKERAKGFLHNTRQAAVVSLVLMLVCGLLFPALLTGLSSLFFPHQAGGSLIEVNGKAVAAENVGQEFLLDYYMWSRPSAYHYNVYKENEDGTKTYQDGAEFPGIGSGSNNYAPSNPKLVKRVEADIAKFLEKNPDVKREDIPTDLLTRTFPRNRQRFKFPVLPRPPVSARIKFAALSRNTPAVSCWVFSVRIQ